MKVSLLSLSAGLFSYFVRTCVCVKKEYGKRPADKDNKDRQRTRDFLRVRGWP